MTANTSSTANDFRTFAIQTESRWSTQSVSHGSYWSYTQTSRTMIGTDIDRSLFWISKEIPVVFIAIYRDRAIKYANIAKNRNIWWNGRISIFGFEPRSERERNEAIEAKKLSQLPLIGSCLCLAILFTNMAFNTKSKYFGVFIIFAVRLSYETQTKQMWFIMTMTSFI